MNRLFSKILPASFKSCPREGASQAYIIRQAADLGFKSCPREGASDYRSVPGKWLGKFQVMPP